MKDIVIVIVVVSIFTLLNYAISFLLFIYSDKLARWIAQMGVRVPFSFRPIKPNFLWVRAGLRLIALFWASMTTWFILFKFILDFENIIKGLKYYE